MAGTQIRQNESTASKRRVLIYLVDETDRYAPETGVTTPTISICKADETSFTNGTGNWYEIGNGCYWYEFAEDEVDTEGVLILRVIKSGVSAEFIKEIYIGHLYAGQILADESVSTKRRVLVYLTDYINGYEAETGISSPTIQICKADETSFSSGSGTFTEIGNGLYWYQFTADELDTQGFLVLRIFDNGVTRDFIKEIEVVMNRIFYMNEMSVDILDPEIEVDVTINNIVVEVA